MENTVLQAIETKFISPTNSRGSRVKATAAAGSVTLPWDHSLNPEQNHYAAARMLQTKFSWQGRLAQGVLPGGNHCFVQLT